jgi:hypothetical protein
VLPKLKKKKESPRNKEAPLWISHCKSFSGIQRICHHLWITEIKHGSWNNDFKIHLATFKQDD